MRATHHTRDRCAQNADHLARNTPFSAYFTEVVCVLGAAPPQAATSPPPTGGKLRHPSLRHADDTPQEGFAWRKTPHRHQRGGHRGTQDQDAAPALAAGHGQASRRRTDQRPSPTGVEGAGGTCRGAGGRRQGLAGLRDDAPSEARGADGSRAGRRPPAHTAAGPTKHTRRPEHPWGHTATQHHHNRTHNETRPRPVSRPRPRHSVSATHRSSGTSSDQAVMST